MRKLAITCLIFISLQQFSGCGLGNKSCMRLNEFASSQEKVNNFFSWLDAEVFGEKVYVDLRARRGVLVGMLEGGTYEVLPQVNWQQFGLKSRNVTLKFKKVDVGGPIIKSNIERIKIGELRSEVIFHNNVKKDFQVRGFKVGSRKLKKIKDGIYLYCD